MVGMSLSTFGVWPDLSGQMALGAFPNWYVRSVTPGSYVACAAAWPAKAPSDPVTATAMTLARPLHVVDKRPPPTRPRTASEATTVLSAAEELLPLR